jgi:hypothetical protein
MIDQGWGLCTCEVKGGFHYMETFRLISKRELFELYNVACSLSVTLHAAAPSA